MTKAILLDRDGTINIDEGYTHKVEDLKFEEGAFKGLKTLQELGYKLIIITGQSGIGRGKYTEAQYHLFMQEMDTRLKAAGDLLDRIGITKRQEIYTESKVLHGVVLLPAKKQPDSEAWQDLN